MDNKKTVDDFRKEVVEFVKANVDYIEYCRYVNNMKIVFIEKDDESFEIYYNTGSNQFIFTSRKSNDILVKIDNNKKLTDYDYESLVKMYETQLMGFKINNERLNKLNTLLRLELNERLNLIIDKDMYKLITDIYYDKGLDETFMSIDFEYNPYGYTIEAPLHTIYTNKFITKYSKENIDAIYNAIKQEHTYMKKTTY